MFWAVALASTDLSARRLITVDPVPSNDSTTLKAFGVTRKSVHFDMPSLHA